MTSPGQRPPHLRNSQVGRFVVSPREASRQRPDIPMTAARSPPHETRVPHTQSEDDTMVRALADGEGRHRLEGVDGRDIGWIVRRAIGFRGFATETHAMDAALDSWRALEASLNGEYAGRPKREVLVDALHIVHEGSSEWISDGRTRLARL